MIHEALVSNGRQSITLPTSVDHSENVGGSLSTATHVDSPCRVIESLRNTSLTYPDIKPNGKERHPRFYPRVLILPNLSSGVSQPFGKPCVQASHVNLDAPSLAAHQLRQVDSRLPQLLSTGRDVSRRTTDGSSDGSLIATTLVSIHPSIDERNSVNSSHGSFLFLRVGFGTPFLRTQTLDLV